MKKKEIKKLYYNILKKEIEEYNNEIDYFLNKYSNKEQNFKIMEKFLIIRNKIGVMVFLEENINNNNYFNVYKALSGRARGFDYDFFDDILKSSYEEFISINRLNKSFFEAMFLKNEKLVQKEVLEIELKNNNSLNNNKNKKIVKV